MKVTWLRSERKRSAKDNASNGAQRQPPGDLRRPSKVGSLLFLLVLITSGCAAPDSGQGQQPNGPGAIPAPRQPTVLRTITTVEPQNLASKFDESGGRTGTPKRALNAALTIIDSRLQPYGVLAEQVPQLSTDSWKVSPDGQMETIYRLRSGLTWHDGHPLTADDFVFAWRVYRNSSLPWISLPPMKINRA
jgi:ABC-type transport system substrate-binding protein